MKIVIYNGLISDDLFVIKEVERSEQIIGINVVGIIPEFNMDDPLEREVARRIQSRLGKSIL